MSLAAGELNRQIVIQARDPAALDALDMPVVGDGAWLTHATVWANVKGSTGMGVIKANNEVGTPVNAYSFRIRYKASVLIDMRVLFGGDKYNIIDVRHDLADRQWTDLICHVGGNDG